MRIKDYLEDNTISLSDKLIGTDAQDANSTKNYTIQDLQEVIRGYKIYTALLTQTGTDAPVATVLENTIGNIWITYNEVGSYWINSNGLFSVNKTALFATPNNGNDYNIIGMQYGTTNFVEILTINAGDLTEGENNLLYNTTIEIRVYN